MDQIGYLNDFSDSLNIKFRAHHLKESTPQAESYVDSCKEVLDQLRRIKKTEDPELMLKTEQTMLDDELMRYSDSPLMAGSLQKARQEIGKAREALQNLHKLGAHKILRDSMSEKDIQKGLPLDAFRKFEKSHQTRLANLLKGNIPHLEKRIVQQRKENLKTCREVYMDMQRQALGLAVKDNDKDLGL